MKTNWIAWSLGLLLVALLIAAPQFQRNALPGIGKWSLIVPREGLVILINTEDGKVWIGHDKDNYTKWRKTERE